MKMINIAGLIAAAVAVAVSAAPSQAADLGKYNGSMKDSGGYDSHMAPRGPVGPCYVRGDLGYSFGRSPKASWSVSEETRDYAGNPIGGAYTSTYNYLGDTVTDTTLGNAFFGGVGLGCGSGSRGIRGEVMLSHTASRKMDGTPLNYAIKEINVGAVGTDGAGSDFVDPLHTTIKSTALMFNGYKDLGSFGGLTPYVGAGVGVSFNKMSSVSFTGNPFLLNTIEGDTRASLAWNLMAGVGYQISDRAVLDLGYRYMDYGKAVSGKVDSAGFINPPVRVESITAHEFKVGLRYHFGHGEHAPVAYQPMK